MQIFCRTQIEISRGKRYKWELWGPYKWPYKMGNWGYFTPISGYFTVLITGSSKLWTRIFIPFFFFRKVASNKSHILIYFGCYKQNMQVLPVFFLPSDFPILLACLLKSLQFECWTKKPATRVVRIEVLCESTGDLYQLGCQTYSSNSELDEVWWKIHIWTWAANFGRGFGGFLPNKNFKEI